MNIEDLFLENMDQLYRTALFMLSNSLDAEDVVQETYVRLLIKKPFFKNKEHGKAWLLRVLHYADNKTLFSIYQLNFKTLART